ncbi:MAG: 50S ribosomal protein L29 [Thermodesulfobacteriota bacterium]
MKPEELRAMTLDEIRKTEEDLASELFNLRMQQAGGQSENPLKIRFVRRDIARTKTIIAEKEREAHHGG